MLFDELKSAWITDLYSSYKAILVPSISKQLSHHGLILDLNSLPTHPYPFKELFIRWLISINKQRISTGQDVLVTKEVILRCPLWKIVRCPLKRMTLTKEGMFNKPGLSKSTTGSIGPVGTIGSINK